MFPVTHVPTETFPEKFSRGPDAFPFIKGTPPQRSVKDGATLEVLNLKDLRRKWFRILEDSQALFSQQGFIEAFKIPKSHTILALGGTQFVPLNLVNAFFLLMTTPQKMLQHDIYIMKESLGEQKDTHSVRGDRLCHCFQENFLLGLWEEFILPIADPAPDSFFDRRKCHPTSPTHQSWKA